MSVSKQQDFSPTEAQALAAELLLEAEQERATVEELFCQFLLMETYFRKLRSRGMSNADILAMCQRMDEQ